MSRFVLVRGAIIALACAGLAFANTATAETLGTTYRAPYKRDISTGATHFSAPCTQGRAPVTTRNPVAATGRLDSSEGVRAAGCSASGSSLARTWILGQAPAALLGKPARISAVVETESASIESSGTGKRDGAITLQIGAGMVWTLIGFDCSASCTKTEPGARVTRFETIVPALPSTVRAMISAHVSLSHGSGVAAVEFLGRLTGVTVTPALG